LGNTVSRLATLVRKGFDGRTPPVAAGGALEAAARTAVAEYRAAMESFAFHRALEALWRLLAEANQYLVAQEPWKKLKDPVAKTAAGEVLWNASEAVRIVAVGLLPVMPQKAAAALAALGAPLPASLAALGWGGLPAGAELAETGAIFPRIDKAQYLAQAPVVAEEKPLINIDRFFETELRVATVVAGEPVPKSNKLLKLTVDLGEEGPRTVVAGIAQQYSAESLVGKQVVIVANLEPAKLMGVESNGMVLAASEGGKPVLLHPEKPVPNGTRVK
jgi:methionyl-tRNA synthetase